MTKQLPDQRQPVNSDPAASLMPKRSPWSGDIIGTLYAAPFALAGVIWLLLITDLQVVRSQWLLYGLLFLAHFGIGQLGFFVIREIAPEVMADYGGSLDEVVTWIGVLLLGPTALWISVLSGALNVYRRRAQFSIPGMAWNRTRNIALQTIEVTLAPLVALSLYPLWGGVFPLPGLTWAAGRPALGLLAVSFVVAKLFWLLFLIILVRGLSQRLDYRSSVRQRRSLAFYAVTMTMPGLALPFAILGAGLYAETGLGGLLFFLAGLFLSSLLAFGLSRSAEHNRQRSAALDQLERLGRALLNRAPDGSNINAILADHVPAMFSGSRVAITIWPQQSLINYPASEPEVPAAAWAWMRNQTEVQRIQPGQALPWRAALAPALILMAPIQEVDGPSVIGAIYIEVRRVLHMHYSAVAEGFIPAAQALAAQIASVLHSAAVYAATLEYQKIEQESVLAGQIQATFLPSSLPKPPGWQLAAYLESARQTSGDFYDVIELPNGRLGILVADVADKGMGAALFMAVSRTLLRTYAVEHVSAPDRVIQAANARLLVDTHSDLFVTVFYGVLDPATGQFAYCNAGHNPPLWLHQGAPGAPVELLRRTGVPLGMFEEAAWQQAQIVLAPGDLLVLYTDGVTEAENGDGAAWGDAALRTLVQTQAAQPAAAVRAAILDAVHQFCGDAAQADDITLMVVRREPSEE